MIEMEDAEINDPDISPDVSKRLHLLDAVIFIFWNLRFIFMETRIALIAIIVENLDSVEKLNGILHEYGKYVIGRMGLPYRKGNISILSVAVDAPQDVISTLSGKIGKLEGISAKTAYSNVTLHDE